MPANPDFRDLLAAFTDADVRYLVVGSYALMHFSQPRYTKDIDVWVEPEPRNAARVLAALRRFGAPLEGLSPDDLVNPALVYQIGIEPNRIDVMMGVPGLAFGDCWRRSVKTTYDGIPIRILSLGDIIAAKKSSRRPKDRADLKRLASLLGKPDRCPGTKRRGRTASKPRRTR